MFYSFAFSAHVVRLCMADIINRGLFERKILRKSVPNNVLFFKVFYHQVVDAGELEHFDVHSVATLLQDALWGCPERILSKKTWRLINYETCTLEHLCTIIPAQHHQLLTDIVRFLVTLMKHKKMNLMDAYQLGDAMGKATLGPADCDSILAEKAGHFLMRMIIEESKQQQRQRTTSRCIQFSSSPLHNKKEATQAKARAYNRRLLKRERQHSDWFTSSDIGLKALLDGYPPTPPDKSSYSIFDTTLDFDTQTHLSYTSPLLFRILANANHQRSLPPLPSTTTTLHDDKSSSYFNLDSEISNKDDSSKMDPCHAFDDVQDFLKQRQQQRPYSDDNGMMGKSTLGPFTKLNRSLSKLKSLNVINKEDGWLMNNKSALGQAHDAPDLFNDLKRTLTLPSHHNKNPLKQIRKMMTSRPKIVTLNAL